MTIEEKVFPELAESEDEKIRKMIINHLNQERGSLSNEEAAEALTWLEKQGVHLENHDDEDILQRFSFYSYKDEPNIIYLSGLYVNAEHQNKGIGTKILSIADEVAVRMGCNVIRLKTEIGSNAEKLYRRNGYNTFQIEGNQVWLEKQKEPELSEDLGDYIAELSKQFPEVSFAKLSRIAVRVKNWLEKQDERKSTDKPKFEIGDEIKTDNEVPLIITKINEQGYWSGDLFICSFEDSAKWELVGKRINKLEPKFHEGDWIIHQGTENIYQVVASIDNQYQLRYGDNYTVQKCTDVDRCSRLWDISDAKDGDVLYSLDSKQPFIFKHRNPNKQAEVYCGINIYGKFFVWNTKDCIITTDKYVPATKEQRDTLERAITNAGYRWDKETHELKKISQRMVSAEAKEALYDEPTDEEMKELLRTEYEKGRADTIAEMKSSWSEEDETGWTNTIIMLKEGASHHFTDFIIVPCVDWLNSLKDRYTWKPSSEQIDALEHFVRSIGESDYASPYENNTKLLYLLLNDLKKLTE